ncbi:CCT motif family protein [Striga asiatica]|uniref:CCT motif family protein n=1 Tax=Striga asiatica TaxID=4170 RepID=A0A5A7P2E8_STRAF|nr:CCT motif family protein [Striga asiatica]
MSTSCLSSGRAAAYKLELLEFDMIKSPSSTSWISNSSSTLSESSNCPLAISTQKHRTPRKRLNQTYNEAAAILSMAYPKLFPTKLKKTFHTKNITFQPDDTSGFLLQYTEKPVFNEKLRGRLGTYRKSCRSPGEIESDVSGQIGDDGREDFDGESIILDEEINCIVGNLGARSESIEGFDIYDEINNNYVDDNCNYNCDFTDNGGLQAGGFCYGYPVGLGFGVRKETRNVDGGDDWWRFNSIGWAQARLARIDLFWDNVGIREASVLRYKEKRCNRLFYKKIRYEARKVNADRRPRMKVCRLTTVASKHLSYNNNKSHFLEICPTYIAFFRKSL